MSTPQSISWIELRMTQTIASSQTVPDAKAASGQFDLFRQGVGGWLFLLPALAFFIGYQVWPIFRVLWLSFTDYQFLSDKPAQWVCENCDRTRICHGKTRARYLGGILARVRGENSREALVD